MKQIMPPPARLAWMIWGLGALLYLFGFYQRVAPAVMTGELMNEFGLSGASLGNLSAFYFYSYVAMQLPTGILADKWGPRRLLSGGALIAGLGTVLFAMAPTIWSANFGRLLIGGSVAVAFVGTLKLAAHWFAPTQFALASGLALMVGILGALMAGVPLQLLISAYGWRLVMLTSAIIPVLLALGIWFIVRDDPQEKGYASYAPSEPLASQKANLGIMDGIREVLRYRNIWLLFFISAGLGGSGLTFAGLWGVPFLTTVYDMPPTQAAAITSALLLATGLGGPIFGTLSDRMARRKQLYTLGCLANVIGWSIIIFVPGLPIPLLVVILITTGFITGTIPITFAFAKESVPSHLAGTASGLCNTGVMLAPMLLQPAVGWMLDRNWQGELLDGARLYSLDAYQAGFSLMLTWAILALLLVFFTQETYGQPIEVREKAMPKLFKEMI